MSFKTHTKEVLAALGEQIEKVDTSTRKGFAGVSDVFDVIFDKLGYDTRTCEPSIDAVQAGIARGYELAYHNERGALLIRKRNAAKKTNKK
jgi:hypothetical protein